MSEWLKTIPKDRDRLQSAVLTWSVGTVLCLALALLLVLAFHGENTGYWCRRAALLSLTFGVLVWALRAATSAAAFCGGIICLLITFGTEHTARSPEAHSALIPLITLFVLTFAATRAGRARKDAAGLAEPKRGRRASQVIANLGVAGLLAAVAMLRSSTPVLVLAALAEATADTISSEIGQAFGGRPVLLTSFKQVAPGTDGAVTVLGTGAGVIASALVVIAGMFALDIGWKLSVIAFVAGILGLFFDSVLGATVERRGWLGNDLVNFCSTAFAVAVCAVLLAL